MAVPVLRLNLVPRPSLWRRNHGPIGWGLLGVGSLTLLLTLAATVGAYRQARLAGRQAGTLTQQARDAARREADLQNALSRIDVEKEMPRWKLAERVLSERSLPWSRLTAELERSMVNDVRMKGVVRLRDSRQQVVVRLKAEARSRQAQVGLIEALMKNGCFSQVVLDRESLQNTGGIEFELALTAAEAPPAYAPLPRPKRSAPAKPGKGQPAKPQPLKAPSPAAMPPAEAPRPEAPKPASPARPIPTPPYRAPNQAPIQGPISPRPMPAPMRRPQRGGDE